MAARQEDLLEKCRATVLGIARLFLVPLATFWLMASACYTQCSCCVHEVPKGHKPQMATPHGKPKIKTMLPPRVAAKPQKRDPRLREFADEPFHGVCFDTPCQRHSVAILVFSTLVLFPAGVIYLALTVSQLPSRVPA